jgi:drug/metabolite transporter (DMT)-like permease
LAVVGFALLSCGDAVIKSVGGTWPAPALAALRFTIAVPFLTLLLWHNQGRGGFAMANWHLQFWRGFAIAASSSCFFLSLFMMPMAEATAIVFISPVLTAVISALWLREPMPWHGWAATALALAGVALVLRPNLAALGVAALLPVIAAIFFSMMMLLNRRVAGTASPLAMQWVLAAVAAPVLIIFVAMGHMTGVSALHVPVPDASVVARAAVVALSASISHWLIYLGTARSSAANVAPATYVQLPVTLMLDALFFRHLPDALALGGAAMIIAAGVLLWRSGAGTPPVRLPAVNQ